MSPEEPSCGGKADIRRMETDTEKTSIVADEATADIDEEEATSAVANEATADIEEGQLTSRWADEAHQHLGVPLAHRMADEATETADAHIFASKVATANSHQRIITTNCSITLLHLHQLGPEQKGSLQDIQE